MRIAISGAGVAGPALAYWLHRTGHTPTLIEQAPAFRTGGYMIDFWGVGYQVAKRMGIEDAAPRRRLSGAVVCGRWTATGGCRRTLQVGRLPRLTGGTIHQPAARRPGRGDLRARSRTRSRRSSATASPAIDDHGDGVRVTFEHGRAAGLRPGGRRRRTALQCAPAGLRPERDVEHYLGCHVAACVVDGYRPRDELVYLTHNVPGRQVAGSRCATTAPCSCSSSAPSDADAATDTERPAAQRVRRRRLGMPADARRAGRRRRPLLRRGQPDPDGPAGRAAAWC